jgi:ATP-dependent DNA helicase RecG
MIRGSPPAAGPLAQPITLLRGVGPERAALLARIEIRTVGELLWHRPRRYEDRRHLGSLAELKLHTAATTHGRIVAQGVKYWKQRQKSVFEFVLEDGTGRLHCRWWNLPYLENHFRVGDEVMVFGKVRSLKPTTMDHPETEIIEGGEERFLNVQRIVPIYPLTEGLTQRWLRGLVWRALDQCASAFPEPWAGLDLADLPSRGVAVRQIHFPDDLDAADAARRRLALDELIELQLAIQRRRRRLLENARALPCGGDNRLMKPFLAGLGFKLTAAQTRVLRELRRDLAGTAPMRRLLQGDVGSGKTVVAACAALMAIESGFDTVFMAPTEILAEQHGHTFARWFGPLGVGVALQTGSQKALLVPPQPSGNSALRPEVRGEKPEPVKLAPAWSAATPPRGDADDASAGAGDPATFPGPTMTLGTHALIEAGFAPGNLGLVIIDEQHKFGVAQRERLVRKGHYPHLLVMTATPIPRTLGLTLYGDLDVSVIDQSPAGRGQVRTHVRSVASLPKVWDFVRQKLAEGRQAYVVCPRVEGSGDGLTARPGGQEPALAGGASVLASAEPERNQPSAEVSARQESRVHPGGRSTGSDAPTGIKAVRDEFARLEVLFAPYAVGLLHGRLPSEQKERVMEAFRGGQIAVLVATSVVEVGVDVPNATVMVIENAESYGLAQLHQLRGRIGRGREDAHCILIAAARTEEARKRLEVLAETRDGFRIAELDLRLRGPGEFLGQAQSGLPSFRFADLARDLALVERARSFAAELPAVS